MPEKDDLCSMGNDSAQGSWWLFLQFSSELPTSDSPQVSVVYSVLPWLEPRVSGCKQNFVCSPFKKLSVSPAVSPLQTEAHFFSQWGVIWVPSSVLAIWAGEPSLEFRPYTSQWEPPPANWPLKYPSRTSAAFCRTPASPTHASAVFTSLVVVKWFPL